MADTKRCKATESFSTVVMWDGRNIRIAWVEGDERDVEPHILELIERDCPGSLKVVKAEKAEKPKVETKAGPTDDAKTRAVVDAPKRTRKTKGKK